MTNWYGFIGKGLAAVYADSLSNIIAVITKPCWSKEEAEEEYVKAYKQLPKSILAEVYGYVNGTIKITEDEKIIIPEKRFCRVIELT